MRMLILGSMVFLAGCAMADGGAPGPNGKPIYRVHSGSAAMMFEKAAEKCPAGYEVVGSPRTDHGGHHEMTVECK